MPPSTPVFDAFAYLAFLAARPRALRIPGHVYNLGLRHPFVAARAVQTLDIVSDGRLEFGIGASWLEQEWVAVGLDFSRRGRRVDEALGRMPEALDRSRRSSIPRRILRLRRCRVFEPKPVRSRGRRSSSAGSGAALRLAARAVRRLDRDGPRLRVWRGSDHDASGGNFGRVRTGCRGRSRSVSADQSTSRWRHQPLGRSGVTRLVVSPWRRSRGDRRHAPLR